MMDSPFYWNMPSRPRYYSPVSREIPVRRQTPEPPAARGVPVQRQPAAAPPKVVSIPVQFVASEASRADSAVKIQKVFRGFLARKGVRKVMALRKEVDEIEKRISEREVLELIRGPESKERVKLIEGLMNLLFRLDSVSGVDSGVRDCRKVTIKKAIALQEAIDAIVAGEADEKLVDVAVELKDGAPEMKDSCSDFISGNCISSENSTIADELQNRIDQPMADSSEVEEEEEAGVIPPPNSSESEPNPEVEDGAMQEPENCNVNSLEEYQGKLELTREAESAETSNTSSVEEGVETSQSHSQDDPAENPRENSAENAPEIEETAMEMHQESEQQQDHVIKSESESERENAKNRRDRDRDILQRMMEENNKMMGLMEELVEKNEKQTRLLNCLSQRVEMLERAFVCEKLRKSKKKRHTC